jgi:hypothetical protein
MGGLFPYSGPSSHVRKWACSMGFSSESPLLNPLEYAQEYAQVATNHWKDIGCVHPTQKIKNKKHLNLCQLD